MNFEEVNGIQTGFGLKVVMYGQEGVGKSSLASQLPDPVFIDCEGSTSRMNVRRLPKPTSWQMFTDEVEYVLANAAAKGYKSLVVDTFDWAERLALEALCTEHKVSGIEGMNYGKGWEFEKEMIGRFLDRTDRLIAAGIDNAGSGEPIQCVIEADSTALIVTGQYDRNGTGTWDIGISLQDEDLSYPDWDMRISFEGYTTVLEIDVPDDVELTWYNNGERIEDYD